MRRFILGWKVLGYARCFEAEIVNYADDFAVLGKAPAAEMRSAVEALLKRLVAHQRREDPLLPGAGGVADIPRLPDWPQLSPGHGTSLHRHPPEPGERPEHLPSRWVS